MRHIGSIFFHCLRLVFIVRDRQAQIIIDIGNSGGQSDGRCSNITWTTQLSTTVRNVLLYKYFKGGILTYILQPINNKCNVSRFRNEVVASGRRTESLDNS